MTWLSFPRRRPSAPLEALREAKDLRRRYGANAEQWCEIGLLAAGDPDKRKLLRNIREALNDLPY
jgi:hypothetical protein